MDKLSTIFDDILETICNGKRDEKLQEKIDTIENELRALEIIKEKRVDIYHIQTTNKVGEYNFWRLPTSKRLKKEEYELLKEVLL